MSIYQHLPYSHCEPGPEDVDGIGNFYLQVLAPAPSQLPLSTLYFLDSHGQKPSMIGNDYEHIKQSQIRWFTRTSQALQRAREKNDYTNLFYLPISLQHIPVPELGDSYLRICKGHRGEPTEGPRYNSNFYKALAKEGILAFFCGHDHVNNFCGLLPRQTQEDGGKTPQPGPWLCYAGCSGFGGYCTYDEKTFHRQMRVLELDTTGSLTTWMRVAYKEGIFDQVVLVESGAVIDLPEEEYKEAV